MALTANVLDNNEVVMNLVPVVSRLLNGVVQTVQIGLLPMAPRSGFLSSMSAK